MVPFVPPKQGETCSRLALSEIAAGFAKIYVPTGSIHPFASFTQTIYVPWLSPVFDEDASYETSSSNEY